MPKSKVKFAGASNDKKIISQETSTIFNISELSLFTATVRSSELKREYRFQASIVSTTFRRYSFLLLRYFPEKLTASILRVLLHINRRFLRPWLPINPFLLLRLLLVDAPAGLPQLLGDVVQAGLRFRFSVLAALPETARYHVLNRVIRPREGLALLLIDLRRPWGRCG